MAHLFVLIFVALPLLKLVLGLAWPGLLKRIEGRRVEAALVQQHGAIIEDHPLVTAVGQRLLGGSGLSARFGVLPGPLRNAVALPNGRILVWQGMVDDLNGDEDMVAGVLAHELGHLQHDHFLSRLQWAALASFMLGILGGGWMRRLLQNMAATVIARGYSRAQEHEADEAALVLMSQAGFDPSGLIRLLDRLARMAPHATTLMGTHPAPSDRAARLRAQLNPSPSNTPPPPAPPTDSNVLIFPGARR